MPVLKIKNNGVWEDVAGMSSSADSINADTLDGKHASEFAASSDVEALKEQVGDATVSEQINSSMSTHTDDKSNPHGVTKEQVGLGNVNNNNITMTLSGTTLNITYTEG